MPNFFFSQLFAMNHVHRRVIQFAHEKNGATAIEYGLIAAGIAIALIAVIFSVGNTLNEFFTTVQTWLQSRN